MKNKSRRRFLEDSLLAAAMVAAGPLATAVGKEKKTKSANEKLGVAVVGVRGRGQAHLSAYIARNDTEVLYVVDPDESIGQSRAEQIEKKQGGLKPKWVRDMREAYDDKSIDIVSIATPNHWHSLAAIWAMQAGKDVYCEKPVSHNVSEGRRMVQTARKHKKICQTGTQCRSMGGSIEAIEYIHSGKIGEVKLARGLCHRLRKPIGPRGVYKVPKEVDYSLWLGPAQMKPLTRPQFHYDWHWQWDYGNGDMGNQGIHQMDLARWGLQLDTLSSQIMSYGGRLAWEDAGETANTQVTIHEFGGKTLVFEVRNLKTDKLMDAHVGVIFYGTDGYVVLNNYLGGVALDKNGKFVKKFSAGGDHFGNFLDAVYSRKMEDLHAEILEGHISSALCHLGNISYRLGSEIPVAEVKKRLAEIKGNEDATATFERVSTYMTSNGLKLDETKLFYGPTLKFDPTAETFTSNEKANAMLTRDYRKPFVVPKPEDV